VKPFWRRRLLVPFLALLGLNLAVFFAYTLPRRMQERNIASRVVVLREEVERERRATAELRRRAETLESNNRDVARFYREVVGGRRIGLLPILQELEGMATSLGLQSPRRSYAPKEVKGVAGLSRFQITMPVTGSYRQLGAFLGALERSPHFLTVDKVSLRQKEGTVADLSIVLSAYFRGEEGASAD
jgi:Tfp pilus assembly protein PilO